MSNILRTSHFSLTLIMQEPLPYPPVRKTRFSVTLVGKGIGILLKYRLVFQSTFPVSGATLMVVPISLPSARLVATKTACSTPCSVNRVGVECESPKPFRGPEFLTGLPVEADQSGGFTHRRNDENLARHDRALGPSPLGRGGPVPVLQGYHPTRLVSLAIDAVDVAEAADEIDGLIRYEGNPAGPGVGKFVPRSRRSTSIFRSRP